MNKVIQGTMRAQIEKEYKLPNASYGHNCGHNYHFHTLITKS